MSDFFAGLDVSTQGAKLVVIDTSSNSIVFSEAVNYDNDLPQFETENGTIKAAAEGVSESDPAMWIEAVKSLFSKLAATGTIAASVRCISVSGQQHGLVSLDAQGNLTRKTSKLWNDFSTLEECNILTEQVGGLENMVAEVGNSQRTGYTAAKILHMRRHEPEAFSRTVTFFLVHNYINWYLTDGVRTMEPGDASGMALWHPAARVWSKRVLEAIDPTLQSKLPSITPSDQSIGIISLELATRFGFPQDCKIDAGSGDNMYGAIGTGNVSEGIVTVSLGTSGTAYTFLADPFVDQTGEIASFCDSTGNYLPLLCVSNLANGYNDVLSQFDITHEQFNDVINKTQPGNEGRLLIPWYIGERTPDVPDAAPLYFGFGLDDFGCEQLCRAVLEGHVLNLYDGFRRLPVEPQEIRLTGGLSKSDAWCQMIADIFEAETVPVEGEGAALGAALHAAWVWEKENGNDLAISEVVAPFITFDQGRRKRPVRDHIETYKTQKQLFSCLSQRVLSGSTESDPFAIRKRLAM